MTVKKTVAKPATKAPAKPRAPRKPRATKATPAKPKAPTEVFKENTNAKVGEVIRIKNKTGNPVAMQEDAPDDTLLRVYNCGKFGEIALTDAEKAVLELVGLNNHGKREAYSTIYIGGSNVVSSAQQWFRVTRRTEYLRFLQSQQIVEVSANISDFVKRIALLIKVTPYDLINPFGGVKDFHDLPEHVLSASKVSLSYDNNGEVKTIKVDLYTLNEIMNMLAQLEEIDPTLAKQFKTELDQSKPKLTRSTPKEIASPPKED